MCSGVSLRSLNVGRFEAVRFAHNKGFIMEITCADVTGYFENTEVCVKQKKQEQLLHVWTI